MVEKILLSQHECVIMGDFNLPNIDWTLQRSILLEFLLEKFIARAILLEFWDNFISCYFIKC